jgi:hypothetical protein
MDCKILVFPSCSQIIPSLFSYVPNDVSMMFPKFQLCSSKVFPITIHFIPYSLPQVFPCTCTPMKMNQKKKKALHLNNKINGLHLFILTKYVLSLFTNEN